MICISLQGKTKDELFAVLDRPEVEMAEIRLDSCPLDLDDIDELFSLTDKPLVATCRIGGKISADQACERLLAAVEAGARFVDLELEAPPQVGKQLCRAAREAGTTVIRSYHDFTLTPSVTELRDILDRCRRFGGEVAKIVTTARTEADIETIKSLYEGQKEGSLLSFCMGENGKRSRMDCLAWGAPYTYAALEAGAEAADGQIPFLEMSSELYGAMPLLSEKELLLPASKSFAQRAIIAAALAEGVSHLSDYTPCDDSEAAITVAEALGAEVTRNGRSLTIKGIGPITEPLGLQTLNVGESGLLARLMIPLMARINGSEPDIEGRGTLLRRPLTGANDILAAFGVVLSNLDPANKKDIHIPLHICGQLLPGRADISGKGGSQLISGLLMALPLAEKNSAIFVHDPRSIPYMFITLDVLRKFGVKIANEMEGDEEFVETKDWSLCSAINFKIRGAQSYRAADFAIEADWSGAAPFMVAGAVFGGVSIASLDTSSLQADLSIMDILVDAGASISQDEDGVVRVRKAPLNAFCTDLNNAPDLFPAVAVLAAFCPGESRIAGVGRLSTKESDRAAAITAMLRQMGVEAGIEGDELVVEGHSLSQRLATGQLLRGGSYTSSHDHRMVMALSVAALGADSPVTIDDTQCVGKSFPDFPDLWHSFTGV